MRGDEIFFLSFLPTSPTRDTKNPSTLPCCTLFSGETLFSSRDSRHFVWVEAFAYQEFFHSSMPMIHLRLSEALKRIGWRWDWSTPCFFSLLGPYPSFREKALQFPRNANLIWCGRICSTGRNHENKMLKRNFSVSSTILISGFNEKKRFFLAFQNFISLLSLLF